LKRDQFAEDAIKFIAFIRKHSTESLAAGVGILVVVAGLVMMGQNRAKSEREAALMIGSAHAAFYSGDLQNAQAAYEEITKKYGSSSSAKEAMVYLGNLYLLQRKFDEALDYYQRAANNGSSNPLIRSAAIGGVAACYEQTNRLPEAAEEYLEIARKYLKEHYLASGALLSAGRCFKLANLNDKAKEAYQLVIKDYPQTQAAGEAKAQMDMLPNR
jgi:TolA-binding protein